MDHRGASPIDMLKRYIQMQIGGVWVCVPARVEAYYPEEARIDAQPLPMMIADGQSIDDQFELPVIPNIPLMWPRVDSSGSGGPKACMYLPIAKGSLVALFFMDFSGENWVTSEDGGTLPYDPEDTRRHDISDPIAFPGIFPFANRMATNSQSPKGSGGVDVDPHDIRIVLEYEENAIQSEIYIGGDTGDVVVIPSPKGAIRLGGAKVGNPAVPQPALKAWLADFLGIVKNLMNTLETTTDSGGNNYPGVFTTAMADLDQLMSDFDSEDPTSYGVINGKVLI